MTRKIKAKVQRVQRTELRLVHLACTVNGYSIDYTRREFSDGTVEEFGLPDGCPPRPSLEELIVLANERSRSIE